MLDEFVEHTGRSVLEMDGDDPISVYWAWPFISYYFENKFKVEMYDRMVATRQDWHSDGMTAEESKRRMCGYFIEDCECPD
jgi:hypothetical protein